MYKPKLSRNRLFLEDQSDKVYMYLFGFFQQIIYFSLELINLDNQIIPFQKFSPQQADSACTVNIIIPA